MDKHAAKREACHIAAQVISTAMDGGWSGGERGYSPNDAARVEAALLALVEELRQRGWKDTAN